MISAKIIADSKNEFGNRITTMIVTMPRIILAEFNTHRMFSRNSASSRAIPFEKMLKTVKENPFIPIAWQKDHKGMQGSLYFDKNSAASVVKGRYPDTLRELQAEWIEARDNAIDIANNLSKLGLTKQLCNRLLEPFMWHTVIVTATEWENFFALRCPKYCYLSDDGVTPIWFRSRKDFMEYDNKQTEIKKVCLEFDEIGWRTINKGQAEIHMMDLAEKMWDAYNESEPKLLTGIPMYLNDWHIPFGDNIDREKVAEIVFGKNHNVKSDDLLTCEVLELFDEVIRKISVARCARVSYTVVGEEKESNYENDIKLHDNLAKAGHWSPFEHCAKIMDKEEANQFDQSTYKEVPFSGNFRGFIQYRKTFKNENITI